MGGCIGKNVRKGEGRSMRTSPSRPVRQPRCLRKAPKKKLWALKTAASALSESPSPSTSDGSISSTLTLRMDLAPLFSRPVGRVVRSFRAATAESLRTALDAFIERGERADLCLLLFVGADLDRVVGGQTALLKAIDARHVEAVQLLVEAGADLEVKMCGGETPLVLACRTLQPSVTEYLLSKGADSNAETDEGWRALHRAAFSGWVGLVKCLLLKGADLHAKSFYGDTALHRSVFGGQREVTELMLQRGARVNEPGENNTTLLFYTVLPRAEGRELTDNREVAELLLSWGADANTRESERGRSALHEAACWGSVEVTKALLNAGADVEAKSKCGCTALHYGAFRVDLMDECGVDMGKKLEIAKMLVKRGSDVNLEDSLGMTAYQVAETHLHADSPLRIFLAAELKQQEAVSPSLSESI